MTELRALYANRWVRYGLTVALLGLVLYKVDLGHVWAAISTAQLRYIIPALLLTLPFLYFKALRWHLMLRAAGVRATFPEAFVSLVGGMGLALVTPARLGELVRGAYLRDPQKLKIGGLVLIDKGFDVLVLSILSVAGAWVLLGAWAGIVLAAVSIVGVITVCRPTVLLGALRGGFSRLPFRAKSERILESLESLNVRQSLIYGALTLMSFAVVLLQFGIILLNWHGWSTQIVFLTFPLVVLTNILPITIGGLGVREAAAAALLGHYGVSAPHAVVAALLMFAMNTAIPGIVGALTLPLTARQRTPPAPVTGPP